MSQGLCQICTKATTEGIDASSYDPSLTICYSLGSSKDIKLRISSQGCELCNIVCYKIGSLEGSVTLRPSRDVSSESREGTPWRRDCHLEIFCHKYNLGSVRIVTKKEFDYVTYTMLLNEDDMSSKLWRNTSPRLLNYERVLFWLQKCQDGHKSSCNLVTGQRYKAYVEIILIDVLEMRLVRARSDWRYLALSYVWGGVTMLQALTENFTKLEQKNSLLKAQEEISATILDAIEVTRGMKERYLWCDTLCIIQNNTEQKYRQIAHMDIIYNHAVLTIATLSGLSARSGLPGVGHEFSGPERILGRTENLFFIPQPLNAIYIDSLPYENRAWTLQERVFSRRCLYFTKQNVFLSCSNGMLAENDAGRIVRYLQSWPPLNESVGAKCLAAYGSILEMYTRRQLSYPSDVLNAFSGIAARLEISCSFFNPERHPIFLTKIPIEMPETLTQVRLEYSRTRLASGLPESYFDFFLLWAPLESSHRRYCPLQSGEYFPSWSWAGWVGPVTHQMKWFDFLRLETIFILFKSEIYAPAIELQGGTLRPIAHYSYFLVTHNNILSGRLKEVASESKVLNNHLPIFLPNALHFFAFTVEATKFSFSDSGIYEISAQLGHTEGAADTVNDNADNHGELAGILFNATIIREESSNVKRALILLSRARKDHFNRDILQPVPESAFGKGNLTVFNVLLIEWKGSFAERLAIGVIGAAARQRANSIKKYIKLR